MDNINELAAALAKAQSKMEGATKDTANPFFKSKYADLASVTGAVRSGLDGTGLAYVQIAHDQPDCAAIETVILHESGQSVSCGIVRVPVAKQDAQGYGSAMTYARRYSLAAAFGVAPEDDDGNAATKAKPVVKAVPLDTGSPSGIEFNQLPPGKQATLREIAEKLSFWTEEENYAAAHEWLQSLNLSNDDKAPLSALLDSKTRSAFKRINEMKKAA
jgi:hypothetical protein